MIPNEYVGWTVLLLDPSGSRILRCQVKGNDRHGALQVDPAALETVKSVRMASPTPHMHRMEVAVGRRWRRVPFEYPVQQPVVELMINVSVDPPNSWIYLAAHTKGLRPAKTGGVALHSGEHWTVACTRRHWPLLIKSTRPQATVQLTFSWTD